jgi:hypothetical protein
VRGDAYRTGWTDPDAAEPHDHLPPLLTRRLGIHQHPALLSHMEVRETRRHHYQFDPIANPERLAHSRPTFAGCFSRITRNSNACPIHPHDGHWRRM